jgi:hypothetical protein
MSDLNAPQVTPIVDPAAAVTQEDLTKWYELSKQLETIKTAEMDLRKKIFKGIFTEPREGVNKHALTDGWILKADHKINRKVDEALLATMSPAMREKGINPDALVKWKPELVTGEYRKLTEEEMKLFDQVLTITEGSPQMEIVLPKR